MTVMLLMRCRVTSVELTLDVYIDACASMAYGQLPSLVSYRPLAADYGLGLADRFNQRRSSFNRAELLRFSNCFWLTELKALDIARCT